MIDIDALVKPLTDLLGAFGPGVLPSGGPADALRATSTAIDQIHQLGKASINQMNTAWDGTAADAATAKALRVQTSAATISDTNSEMATVVNQAAAEVESGQKDLNGIVQSFVASATALGPAIATPPGMAAVVSSAIDHLNQALGVVGRVQNELDTHTASMNQLTPPPSTSPAGALAAGMGQQLLSGASTVASSASQLLTTMVSTPLATSTPATTTQSAPSAPTAPGTPSQNTGSGAPTGEGVEITLPDGSRVEAPNEQAATAVKAALGTLGTPYVWGGTSPGAGLDCSGLTQYAYGEAGVELPRLAQEQHNGATQVSPGDLMPGDLAVWDGHVAMVIGNGQFVEAGDPVQISSVRTENVGMDFYGFYRPTA